MYQTKKSLSHTHDINDVGFQQYFSEILLNPTSLMSCYPINQTPFYIRKCIRMCQFPLTETHLFLTLKDSLLGYFSVRVISLRYPPGGTSTHLNMQKGKANKTYCCVSVQFIVVAKLIRAGTMKIQLDFVCQTLLVIETLNKIIYSQINNLYQ